jgi:hypothetical protein
MLTVNMAYQFCERQREADHIYYRVIHHIRTRPISSPFAPPASYAAKGLQPQIANAPLRRGTYDKSPRDLSYQFGGPSGPGMTIRISN